MPPVPFRTVIFDCDSTLCAIEGIEELADEHRAEVAAMTEAAMRGELPLEDVYGRRLELIRPTRARLDHLATRYVATIVPDARETVAALRAEGIEVRIVSGGLRPAVLAAAAALGVPDDHVAAVDIRFDTAGEFAGWDSASPLARSGGKRAQLERWAPSMPAPVMMVGDGITDLEARPPADLFVAFAGVAAREAVIAAADVVVRDRSLAPVLALALAGAAPKSDAARDLLARRATAAPPDDRSRDRSASRASQPR